MKFDVAVSETAVAKGHALRAMFGVSRPVWVAGSTREGEEEMLLDAMQLDERQRDATLHNATLHNAITDRHADSRPPDAPPSGSDAATSPLIRHPLLVIVPRHPQRFDEVVALVRKRGLNVIRRSENRVVPADVDVVVGDSMGEMLAYYAAADVAFIGGSLLPLGGQNLIEPLAVGTPVVIGPSSYNFAEVTRHAVAAGAAVQCPDAGSVIDVVSKLVEDPLSRETMRAAARRLLEEHRGATERTMNYLKGRLQT